MNRQSKKLGTVFIALLLMTFSESAFSQSKEKPPEGSAPKPFKVPAKQSFQLKNGLQVTVVPYGVIPKLTMVLTLRGGQITEPKGKDGVAGLTASLMKEGTKAKTADQLAQAAASIGGEIEVSAGDDQIIVVGNGLSDHASELAELMAEVTTAPRLPESELDRLRKDLLRNIAVAKTTPGTLANEKFHQVIYGDTAYGRVLPNENSVQSITIDDIRSYYSTHFVASNARLYVAGVLDAKLSEQIRQAFAGWTEGKRPDVPSIRAQAKPALELIDRPNASQSTVYVGLPVGTPTAADAIPLKVSNSLLGGSFASRITSNIREQKGYTYSPRSVIEEKVGNSVWYESADVTTTVTGASIKEIYSEIDRLRKEAPPEQELKGIQTNMAGMFVLQNSSRNGIINQLAKVDLLGLPTDYLETYVQKVHAVKPADVQGIAEKYFTPGKMTLVVVGDKSKVADQVAPYKPAQ